MGYPLARSGLRCAEHRSPAEVLLNTIVSLGLARLEEYHRSLTPVAEDYLLEDSPTYFGAFLDMLIANDQVFSFESVKEAIITDSAQVYGGEGLFASHEAQVARPQAIGEESDRGGTTRAGITRRPCRLDRPRMAAHPHRSRRPRS